MLSSLMHTAQAAATRTAHTAVLGLAAGVTLAIGAGFFTLAAWLMLLTVTTPLYAAVSLGCGFFGIGLIILAIMSIRSRSQKHPVKQPVTAAPDADADIYNQVVMTFLAGVTAGRKARS